MCCLQPPGKLDRDIQDFFEGIEFAALNPLGKRTACHIIGKDGQPVMDSTEEPAGNDVRMIRQIHPCPEFPNESASLGHIGKRTLEQCFDGIAGIGEDA